MIGFHDIPVVLVGGPAHGRRLVLPVPRREFRVPIPPPPVDPDEDDEEMWERWSQEPVVKSATYILMRGKYHNSPWVGNYKKPNE